MQKYVPKAAMIDQRVQVQEGQFHLLGDDFGCDMGRHYEHLMNGIAESAGQYMLLPNLLKLRFG
jgi:hypothetical protein